MANKYFTLVTKLGQAKLANASVTGEKLAFSKIALGSGEGTPNESQTALQSEKWRGPVSNVAIDESNPNWVVIEAVIPHNAGGFTIAEIGVYDEAGDLVVVGNYPKTYKPVVEEGTTKDVAIRIIIEVSNAENVTIKVDPSVVIATRKYVDNAIDKAVGSIDFTEIDSHISATNNPHNVTKAQVGLAKVLDYGLATEADAEAGTSHQKYMTPLRTKQAIAKQAATLVTTHVEDKTNPHKVTKSQVGLSNVDNVKQASKEEHDRLAQSVETHLADETNPHNVTSGQVNVIDRTNIDANTQPINYPYGITEFLETRTTQSTTWKDALGLPYLAIGFRLLIQTEKPSILILNTGFGTAQQTLTYITSKGDNVGKIEAVYKRIAVYTANADGTYTYTWGPFVKQIDFNGGEMQGVLTAHPNTSYTVPQVRNILLKTSEPTAEELGEGEICFVYEE